VAFALGRGFRYVTIEPEPADNTLGHVLYAPWPRSARPDVEMTPRTRILCEQSIITALAGPRAEKHFTGRWNNAGARSDHSTAFDFAQRVCGSSESAEAYLKWLDVRIRELVEGPRWQPAIRALADALLLKKRLTKDEAHDVMTQAFRVR